MAMKRRSAEQQSSLWIAHDEMVSSPGHPFYERLNGILADEGFDVYVEDLCAPYYAEKRGRPSIAPGVYFRMLLVGYFERIDSERGICWRCSDSLSLRSFLGLRLDEETPDHSSLSRIRTRLLLELHEEVFGWVLMTLAKFNLIDGKTIGVDATTLEANAALRSIVRRDTGESYDSFLEGLAKESGIENPTRKDLVKLDKKRKKKGSNKDWVNPHDPDAQIMKMKSGGTHLAHKAEHGVDMSGHGAILSVTLHGGATGDTKSMGATVETADANLQDLADDPSTANLIHNDPCREIVADKGYHGNDMLVALADSGYRSYISEPDHGRRKWVGKEDAQAATYSNRRRIKGDRGKRLIRRRGELLERPFAHYLEAGGMRRTHLRHHENILKRLLVHVAGFNLGILMRNILGAGMPREYADLRGALRRLLSGLIRILGGAWLCVTRLRRRVRRYLGWPERRRTPATPRMSWTTNRQRWFFSTGC